MLVNPVAGGGRTGSHLLQIHRVFEARRIPAEFVVTESLEDLEAQAQSAIDRGQRLLFAMGGDGTFLRVVRLAASEELRQSVRAWLDAQPERPDHVTADDWLRFEQEKHERLLAAA